MIGAAVWASEHVTAWAREEVDCKAVARDGIRVDLAALAKDTRIVRLRAGETLRLTLDGGGPFGTLTLIEGPGAPRVLLAGPSGTAASLTAERSGAFGFLFAKEGEDAARFTVSCAAPRAADSGSAPKREPGFQLGEVPIGDGDALAHALQIDGPDGVAPSSAVPIDPPPPKAYPGVTIADPAAGAKMSLRWLEQRYRLGGPDGPQIDPNASGVEIGVNYRLESALTIGALAQVNPAPELLLGGHRSLADQGWMAGPVTTIKVAPGLVLDARAAWGEGESGPEEAAAVAAQRRLVSARLANQQAFGAWRFTPSVNFNYLEESLHGPHVAVAPQATGAGRIDLSPELAYRMDLASKSFIEPRAVVGGFWNFDSLSGVAPGAAGHLEMRLKAEAGVTIGVLDGPKLQALGGVEAGDHETPDAWSGRLQLSVPLK